MLDDEDTVTNDKLPARNTEGRTLTQVGIPPQMSPDQPVVTNDPVGSDYDEESGLDVNRLVAAVWRFKWLVVLTTILGGGGGGGSLVPGGQRIHRGSLSLDPGYEPG